MSSTQIRIGGVRIGLRAGAQILDACEVLEAITRINLRALRDDADLRDDAMRRVLSPPCVDRCYVSEDGSRNDCDCASGFQYASDPEAQALEGCPARDVWNDLRSLGISHHDSGRGHHEPIVADCDCLAPATIAVYAYIAWFMPDKYQIQGVRAFNGVNLGAYRSPEKRFAIGITLPPFEAGKERIGHAYGLMNHIPLPPQPAIVMPYADGPWYVLDPSAHWGMRRPPDNYYPTGEIAAFELRRDALDGLRRV